MASITDSFLMIPRELPNYLQVAYSHRYANEPNEGCCLSRVSTVAQRIFSLVKELLFYHSTKRGFQVTREKLQKEFAKINRTVANNQMPLCIYFVSEHDETGGILGHQIYYYHMYKIQNLQQHYAVAPKLVGSQEEMIDFQRTLRTQYPGREIKLIDAVSHGFKSAWSIQSPDGPSPIKPEELRADLFEDCAPDATILLDACYTGLGNRNIADEIARKTPGRTVLAPGTSMVFSKPIIRVEAGAPKVVAVVHGNGFNCGMINASTCKAFSYSQQMPSRYPNVNDDCLLDDFFFAGEVLCHSKSTARSLSSR